MELSYEAAGKAKHAGAPEPVPWVTFSCRHPVSDWPFSALVYHVLSSHQPLGAWWREVEVGVRRPLVAMELLQGIGRVGNHPDHP
jgi:hypothetical protein